MTQPAQALVPDTPPAFSPAIQPTTRYLGFVLDRATPGWGAASIMLQDDDFDDLLAAIPMDCAAWHIVDRAAGRIMAGSDPNTDKLHKPFPRLARNHLGDVIETHDRDASEAARLGAGPDWTHRYWTFVARKGVWGAWTASGTSEDVLTAIRAGRASGADWHVLDTETSTVGATHEGPGIRHVIPSIVQVLAYEQEVAAWRIARIAETGGPVITEDDALTLEWAQSGTLPEGWQDLPTDELRALVEKHEAAAQS